MSDSSGRAFLSAADHVHDHSHAGDHVHPEDNSHAGQGPVVLDIGGDIGALIVAMPAAMEGLEVEICPSGERPAGHVPHVAVVGRPTAAGIAYSTVFPDLYQGAYDLNERYHDEVVLTVSVTGGEITFANWPVDAPAMPTVVDSSQGEQPR